MTDTTPLITGVDFVCIPAQDFDAMTAFYGETLGLPFVKRYGNLGPGIEAAIAAYAKDVRSRAFPGPEQVYEMRPQAPKVPKAPKRLIES